MTQSTLVQHPEYCDSLVAHEGSNVNTVKIEFGKETTTIIAVLLIVIAGCGTIMGVNLAKQSQLDADFKDLKTQEWLKERRLMDAEAYMIANGIKVPKDESFGPTGNIERMKPKER